MEKKVQSSVLPIYAAAAVWIIAALFFKLYAVSHFLLTAVLSYGAFRLLRLWENNKKEKEPAAEEKKEEEKPVQEVKTEEKPKRTAKKKAEKKEETPAPTPVVTEEKSAEVKAEELPKKRTRKIKTVEEVNLAAQKGTIEAHVSANVPVLQISIGEINEEHLGYLFYFFELSCAISGKFLDVNPFNQPGVEDYKKNMKKYLS